MPHQRHVQSAAGCPPDLYGSYECQAEESWKGRQWASMYVYTGSSLLTKFERKQKKKRYEELEATLALVAACDAWDRTGLNWERNCIWEVVECKEVEGAYTVQ